MGSICNFGYISCIGFMQSTISCGRILLHCNQETTTRPCIGLSFLKTQFLKWGQRYDLSPTHKLALTSHVRPFRRFQEMDQLQKIKFPSLGPMNGLIPYIKHAYSILSSYLGIQSSIPYYVRPLQVFLNSPLQGVVCRNEAINISLTLFHNMYVLRNLLLFLPLYIFTHTLLTLVGM